MSDRKQPFGPRLVPADSMHDGPLRVAVVGYGYWGPNLARNVIERPELELAALCERDPARAAAFEQRVPGVPVVSDLDRVLEDPTDRRRHRRDAAADALPARQGSRSRRASTCSSRSRWRAPRPRRRTWWTSRSGATSC